MLVLSRRPGERILIGGNVEVVVVSVQGNTVRLGITAPKDVPVHRQEVRERMNNKPETVFVVERATLPRLDKMALDGRVILDFSKVETVCSTDLAHIITLHKRLLKRGGELVLRDMQPFVQEVFQVTKVNSFLKVEFTEAHT
jgi:carbon storage regulator